jgi:hypothetical protein
VFGGVSIYNLVFRFSADLTIDPKMDVPSQLQTTINGSSPSLNSSTTKEALNIENFRIKTAIQVDKNTVRLSLAELVMNHPQVDAN